MMCFFFGVGIHLYIYVIIFRGLVSEREKKRMKEDDGLSGIVLAIRTLYLSKVVFITNS